MRILALIPARGGSKRVPGKNIRVLGGRPLLVWSIDVAKNIPEICDTLVSTDDVEIAAIARRSDALVPWLRPAELSGDSALSVDVALHALTWYEGARGDVDGLMLLQPTSPFRSRSTILRGIGLFRDNGRHSVVGVSPAAAHPMWCFTVNGNSMRPFIEGGCSRSQDLPPAYVLNGVFYLIAPGELRRQKSFQGADTVPLIIEDRMESVDIDTQWDWNVAAALLASKGATS